MPTTKLTQAAVERLKAPANGRVEYWDSQLPGFGLRISAPRPGSKEGRRTWQAFYRVNGKMVRETLGSLAVIPDVAKARHLARESMARARSGAHPVEERRREEQQALQQAEAERARAQNTLAVVIDRYLEDARTGRNRKRPMRRDYYAETKRTLERDVKAALGERPVSEINRSAVRELLAGIVDRGAPSQANHVLTYLKALLNWAVSEDLLAKNPADGIKMPGPRIERRRALDDDEIRLFWRACDKIGWPFGPLFELLLLTGQRRDELAQATWPEFGDLDKRLWRIPPERTKNNREHLVHLSPLAIEILDALPRIGRRGYVFSTGRRGDTPVSGWSHAAERLAVTMVELRRQDLAEAGRDQQGVSPVEHFTRHDLRRTAATGMAAIGVAPHLVDKILNHTTGKISGVAAIYNRFEYLPERKAALEAWSRHVESLIRPTPSNVVELPRRVEV
jgi:integrase